MLPNLFPSPTADIVGQTLGLSGSDSREEKISHFPFSHSGQPLSSQHSSLVSQKSSIYSTQTHKRVVDVSELFSHLAVHFLFQVGRCVSLQGVVQYHCCEDMLSGLHTSNGLFQGSDVVSWLQLESVY